MNLLRPRDANAARRQLRAVLLKRLPDGGPSSDVPPSFDSGPLLAYANEALDEERQSGGASARLLSGTGRVMATLGDIDGAETLLREALDRAADDGERSGALYDLALHVHMPRQERDAAREHLERARRIVPGERRRRALTYFAEAEIFMALGAHDRGLRALALASRLRIREFAAALELREATLRADRGDLDSAIEIGRAAADHFREQGDEVGRLTAEADVAIFHFQAGRYDDALALFDAVDTQAFDALDLQILGRVANTRGALHRRRGDYASAETAYARAARCHTEAGRLNEVPVVLRNLVLCRACEGDVEGAAALLSETADYCATRGFRADELRCWLRLVELADDGALPASVASVAVRRCRPLLEDTSVEHDRATLARFTGTLLRLADRGVSLRAAPSDMPLVPSVEVRDRARETMDATVVPHLETRLETMLLPISSARWPASRRLSRFLLSWAGRRFRSEHFQREFAIPQESAKYRLRGLRDLGAIAQEGRRKGSSYVLAFQHRIWEGVR